MDGGILGRPRRRNSDASTPLFLPARLESNLLGYRTPLPPGNPPVTRGPKNPNPWHLDWDAGKRAFRLKHPPTHCDCKTHRSSVTGEKVNCGLCDGRANPPVRFQAAPVPTACRYCGALNEGGVCRRCLAAKERLSVDGVTEDDQILRGIQRILAVIDRKRLAEAETAEAKQKRTTNRIRAQKRWERVAAA
jgi:hypothetical protein